MEKIQVQSSNVDRILKAVVYPLEIEIIDDAKPIRNKRFRITERQLEILLKHTVRKFQRQLAIRLMEP